MNFFDKLKGDDILKEEQGKEEKEKKKTKKIKVEKIKQIPAVKKDGSESEGQLAIDVYETNGDFIIQSTIAGVKAGDLDISIENDMVTIRGSRQKSTEEEGKNYFYQECHWGSFSRKVILPEEVDGSRVKAVMKDGVLTLRLPKLQRKAKRKIVIQQEE